MKVWQKVLLCWLFFSASTSLLAVKMQDRQWFSLKNGNVSFELPTNWQAKKNLLGMPLMILGPKKKESRITIGVIPTGIPLSKWNPKELGQKKHRDYYFKSKKKFLEKINGKIIKILPYKKEKWTNTKEVHSIGHRYAVNSITFVERVYYVSCDKKVFQMKGLYKEKDYRAGDKKIETVLQSFNCKMGGL